ncbi:MAG: Unknown protein [uncultured Sulfurovum sp.]|uniref:Uncharacterized protein n=1 Tax=uncultured Sulfurovum sp. TaxID=269237 RepID=A0A6S6U870_9BACT|nr:MAG: Unknown protein [uncultured Sulfurovum sp.]
MDFALVAITAMAIGFALVLFYAIEKLSEA